MSWLGAGPTWLTSLALLRPLEGLWWRAKILDETQETWSLATVYCQVLCNGVTVAGEAVERI